MGWRTAESVIRPGGKFKARLRRQTAREREALADGGERVITHGALKVRPGQTVAVRAIDRGGEDLEALLGQSPPQASR